VAAAAAAAVVIPALGFAAFQTLGGEDKSAPPANPGPTAPADPYADFLTGNRPNPKLLDGLWRVDNDTMLMLFRTDGTMRFDNSGTLYSNPAVTGSYEIEGDLITVSIDSGPAECIGQAFAMRASLPAAGEMRFVQIQPAIEGCSPLRDDRLIRMEQVLPTYNEWLAGFNVPAKGDWQPPAGLTSLYGDWMAEVTDPLWPANTGGRVLEIAPDGSYTVASGSHGAVADRGRWTFDSSASRLSLVSAGDSPTCDQGDRLVPGGVEHLDPRHHPHARDSEAEHLRRRLGIARVDLASP